MPLYSVCLPGLGLAGVVGEWWWWWLWIGLLWWRWYTSSILVGVGEVKERCRGGGGVMGLW